MLGMTSVARIRRTGNRCWPNIMASARRLQAICSTLMTNMIEYSKEHGLSRIDLVATSEGYPIYKKLGFEDRVQKYIDMRMKLNQ